MKTTVATRSRDEKRRYWRQFKRNRYKEARTLLGGVCVICKTTEDLEIDHIDPMTKEFRITDVLTMRAELRLRELGKCQLLCTDCHSDKTEDDDDAAVVPF